MPQGYGDPKIAFAKDTRESDASMRLGPAVRTRLGRFEQPAAEAYRAMFINLDNFAEQVANAVPKATRVLEIGCGDGSVADRITRTYPNATYVGIDVASDPGRRYTGDRARATFESETSSQLRARNPDPFDLVAVVDVLHHVHEDDDRVQLLQDAVAMLAPDGTLVVKEWARTRQLSYLAGVAADRYISGDRKVRFLDAAELGELIAGAAPELVATGTTTVRPWACNLLVTARRP